MSLWGFKIEGVRKIGKIGEVGKGVFFLSRTISAIFVQGFHCLFSLHSSTRKTKKVFGQNRAKRLEKRWEAQKVYAHQNNTSGNQKFMEISTTATFQLQLPTRWDPVSVRWPIKNPLIGIINIPRQTHL